MMKMSVICNIYYPNQACFKRFLDACIVQTLSDVEFILTLDGPNDIESRKTLQEYASKFINNKNTFLIIENPENYGIEKCYKNALMKTNGKYIFNPDDDDFFDSDYLEGVYTYLEETGYDCVKLNVITGYVTDTLLYEVQLDTQTFIYKRDYGIKHKEAFSSCFTDFHTLDWVELPPELGLFYYYVRNSEGTTLRTESNNLDGWNPKSLDLLSCYKDHKKYYCAIYKDQGITMNMSIAEMHEILYNNKDNMVFNKDLNYDFLKEIQ